MKVYSYIFFTMFRVLRFFYFAWYNCKRIHSFVGLPLITHRTAFLLEREQRIIGPSNTYIDRSKTQRDRSKNDSDRKKNDRNDSSHRYKCQ